MHAERALEAVPARHRIESVRLPSGVALQYVEHGGPSGTPVVLLHGVTDSWRSFEHLLSSLPSSLHALALTQRGHGDADRPEGGYRTRDFAGDVAAFMSARRLERAVIVGHSMGATHALRFAIDHPERTRGLVLMGTFATYRANPAVSALWRDELAHLRDPIDPAFVRAFQESTLATPLPERSLEVFIAESLKVPARVWRAVFEGLCEDDFVHELGSIRAPTLLVWGDRDALVPREHQEALLEAIVGSRLVTYAGAGHALHWEQPERFAADLVAFVESLTGPD